MSAVGLTVVPSLTSKPLTSRSSLFSLSSISMLAGAVAAGSQPMKVTPLTAGGVGNSRLSSLMTMYSSGV